MSINTVTRTDRVRMVALVYRKPDMSFEEFDRYWREVHSKVFTSIDVVKRNLLKYEQAHNNPAAMAQLQVMGFSVPDFDGLAIFEAESFDKITEVFADPDYQNIVVPDEKKFIHVKRVTACSCDLVTVWEKEEENGAAKM